MTCAIWVNKNKPNKQLTPAMLTFFKIEKLNFADFFLIIRECEISQPALSKIIFLTIFRIDLRRLKMLIDI